MNKKFTYLTLGLSAILIMSCERAINIPLNEAERKVVIEMEVKNFTNQAWVRLSMTGSVYDDSDYDRISDATITVTDKDGVTTTFNETSEAGYYTKTSFSVVPNNAYDLSVIVDGVEYTAHAETNPVVNIDTAYYQLVPNVFGAIFGDTTDSILELRYSFLDDASKENFYIRRSAINGGDYQAVAFDDDLWNGQQVDGTMSSITPEYGDTIFTELMAVDKGVYQFFESLSGNTSSTTTPANPVSNIEGGALGYFGVFIVDTTTIIIPE